LNIEEEYRLDSKNRRLKDDKGEDLPPLWRPTKLHALDVVDTGDATNSFLSAESLPDALVRKGCELLDQAFPDASREVIAARLDAWKERYLTERFGEPEELTEQPPEAAPKEDP